MSCYNFIVGQTLFLCPVLKKFEDLDSDSVIWQLLLHYWVYTPSVLLQSLVSYTYTWRFCCCLPSKGLVCFLLQHFIIPFYRNWGVFWLALLFVLFDVHLGEVPVWSWQMVMMRRIPTFAGGSMDTIVGMIYLSNLMLAFWFPHMSPWILVLVAKFKNEFHLRRC